MSWFDCEAILFDLDGVLVDSAYSVEQATRIWAERHGLDADQILEVSVEISKQLTAFSFHSKWKWIGMCL
jgi:beta-phosphoglucomutase-like phosphatase (HAD superfamily)